MNRRQFLTLSALSISLSGCTERDSSGTPTPEEDSGGTPSPEGAAPECWPSMCEGTTLVEVIVSSGFSGDVTLQADCRDRGFSIQSGESVEINREEDAETCEISLSIDGEQEYTENIDDYESLTLRVSSNGEIDEEWVVV